MLLTRSKAGMEGVPEARQHSLPLLEPEDHLNHLQTEAACPCLRPGRVPTCGISFAPPPEPLLTELIEAEFFEDESGFFFSF